MIGRFLLLVGEVVPSDQSDQSDESDTGATPPKHCF